jgi:hypothetical protein
VKEEKYGEEGKMKRCIMKYRKPVNKIIYGRNSIGK